MHRQSSAAVLSTQPKALCGRFCPCGEPKSRLGGKAFAVSGVGRLSSWWLVQSEGPPAVLLLPGLLPEWWPLACAPLGHRQLRSNCNPPFGDIGSIALRTGRGLLGWACFLGSLVFLALVTAPFTGLCCFRSSCSSEHWACPIQPAAVQCLFTTLHQRCSCPSAARSVQAEPELALHLSTQPVNPRMFRCPERR